MSLRAKQWIIFVLGLVFLASLVFVQYKEVARKEAEVGIRPAHINVPKNSKQCVDCHQQQSPGIIDHWTSSTHAEKGVGCVECHQAKEGEIDAFSHEGTLIATVVTPKDCGRCHEKETAEFLASHHAKAGNILASLDNFLAEWAEGNPEPYNPHSPTPGILEPGEKVNGMGTVNVGCKQCHGAKVAIQSTDGSLITVDDLFEKGEDGKYDPTKPVSSTVLASFVEKVKKDTNGRPMLDSSGWPNTGIGRINLDGSRGSCSACHSRHDFSPRRARQPENCGKCHLGPDHPQKEVYEESKHGIAYRDMKDKLNLDGESWVLGEDYSAAPTCATCHMSAHSKANDETGDGDVTHDPGMRISWTNRPKISMLMDTDKHHKVIKEKDPAKRRDAVSDGGDSWQQKRTRMQNVCTHCHTPNYVDAFYQQYDDFIINYNEKFGKPGIAIMASLKKHELTTPRPFDEEIEWTWFYLWHHEGRRGRHGAAMMAPDYAHWHGMYEVAERFYLELIPQALELCHQGEERGNVDGAEAARKVIDDIMNRDEHKWFEEQRKERDAKTAEAAVEPPAEPAAEPDAPDGEVAEAAEEEEKA